MATYRHIVSFRMTTCSKPMSESHADSSLPTAPQAWLKPTIHPAYLRLLCGHLKHQGIDIEQVFSANSLNWDTLLASQRFVSFEQFRRVALNAMQLSHCPWLGLEISSMIQVSAHGPMGYGAVASQNVRQAFRLVEKMMPTRISLFDFQLEEGEHRAYFKLYERIDLGELREFILVMLLGSYFDMLEKIAGVGRDDIRTQLPFAEPSWSALYSERFPGTRFEFGCENFSIDMPVSLLDMACFTADEFAYRNAVRECEQLLASKNQGGELAEQIKLLLFNAKLPYPTQEELAGHFNLSVRTLIRKLKQEGAPYQSLLDEVRKELACWHLLNSQASIEQVAERLGFQDTSNFSRVFRRWFGLTPSDFRSRALSA